MIKNKKLIFIALCAISLFVSCADNNENEEKPEEHIDWQIRKIAMVLPMSYGQQLHWEQTVQMASAGIQDVQKQNILNDPGKPDPQLIKMEFEWYDEETVDLDKLGEELASRDEIVAVIGGKYSADAAKLASPLCRARKPFFTIATTNELVRAYAGTGSLWAMVETDITQCEVLLSRALFYGAKSVSLLANGETLYGKTFVDWLGFQAEELGLEVKAIYDFRPETLEQSADEAAHGDADVVICVSNATKDVATMENAFRKANSRSRRLYSDTAYGEELIERFGSEVEGIEGVTFGAAPESGFDILYEIKYGSQPSHGEPQIYDAIIMLGWALINQLNADEEAPINTFLKEVATSGIAGACGPIEFDHVVYTNVLSTTYYHYMLYQGRFIILDYISSTGSHRTDPTLGAWSWKAEQMQDFKDEGSSITYPELDKKWALLVAASNGWKNYRHQADVLQMYQILRQQGYDDDHIVLIMEDDIANNPKNPQPGVIKVRTEEDAPNVYKDVVIDYKTSSLEPEDITHILCGEKSERLPHVIQGDSDDNVLIFWSGHGSPGQMIWLDREEGFTTELAQQTFAAMNGHYRKLLCLIEACYSGSVMKAAEGFPGVLAFTAASPTETSKADIYSTDLNVWMSNRFTATLQDCITNSPDISMRDLYYRLFINTVGSHVMVYNASNYGDIYLDSMEEYLK
ncbi:MAG: ABC transporter substrate-binding protein [Bacteroidaceae bacterium]|nr:ABC transporter substrate-binding protein [Bacteroidaceae bacterium]